VGLIITGHGYVTRTGQASPGQIGLYSDDVAETLRPVAEAVHREGGKIMVQISHAGRVASPQLNDGVKPKGPSAVPPGKDYEPPDELTGIEINDLVKAYGQAARRVKAAGFDGLQLHGAHGYLISQFLSPHTNRRSDRWGGSFDNRLSFLRAVCDEVRSQVGSDFPMLIKLVSQDWVTGGLTVRDCAHIASRLADFGLDAIEVSGGVQEGPVSNNVRLGVKTVADEAYFLDNARRLRDATDLPLLIVGGFRTPEIIERAISEEGMDFVSLCRPLLNDPELPNKWRAGSDERAGCISCNLCLKNRYAPLRCWYRYPDEGQGR
jgi:2,4-dienoyl-CoA reductase-like NADH-dependent reductase (Old Yellow Enzyme family)